MTKDQLADSIDPPQFSSPKFNIDDTDIEDLNLQDLLQDIPKTTKTTETEEQPTTNADSSPGT